MTVASERRAYDRFSTYETTDDTPTETVTVQLAADYSGCFTAYVMAQRYTTSSSYLFSIVSCYVETDGTVTAGTPYDVISGGTGSTLAVTWVATGSNEIAVQITGNASETWGWTVHVEGQAQAYTVGDEPVAFANVQLWLDANDLALGTGNTTWADRTANGYDGTLVGSPNVSDGYGTGSHRMITLNGSSQYITADGVGPVAAGSDTPVSVVMVCRLHTNAAAYNSYFAFDRTSSSVPLLEMYKNNTVSGALICIKRDDANSLASANGSASNTSNLVLVYSHSGTTVTTWRNGSIDLNAAAMDRGTTTTDNFSVGVVRRGGTPASYAPLEVCEVIVWDKALNSTEAASEYARLSSKWA
ncbi:MAG: hypothetical protein H6718_04050 [Polyangiaceae bacterium]|nr:hypothetical protein [Polyangiaceae bacterium]